MVFGKRFGVSALVLAALGLGNATKVNADIKLKTHLPETEIVADGTTEYQMFVLGDTMEHPGVQINTIEYDVQVPNYFNITSASLPSPNNPSDNPEDFFYNHQMYGPLNYVDSTVENGELSSNVRQTDNVFQGPSDLSWKVVGVYTFTANPADHPTHPSPMDSTGSFTMDDVFIGDTNFNEYMSSDNGSGVTTSNVTYTIKAPEAPVTMDDIPVFTNHLVNGTYNERYDYDGNGALDGRDMYGFVSELTDNN